MDLSSTFPARFAEHIGCRLEQSEAGRSRVSMPILPMHANLSGAVHGGAIATLADCALGWAVLSLLRPGESTVTVEIKLNYTAAARGDLVAEGTVAHRGRQTAVAEVDIHDSAERLVAKGLATFLIMPDRTE